MNRIIWTPPAEPTTALVAYLADAACGKLYIVTNDGVRLAAELLADHDQQAHDDALADWLAQEMEENLN